MKQSLSVGISISTLLGAAFCVTGQAQGIPEPDLIIYGQVRNTQPWPGGANIRLTTGFLQWTFQPNNGGPPVVLATQLTNLNDQFSFVIRVPQETQLAGFTTSSNAMILTNPPLVYVRTNVTLDGSPIFLKFPSQGTLTNTPLNRGGYQRVDLTLQRADQDSNGNGLPDWWEDLYFPGVGANPNDDSDGDGRNNLAEYIAGTNPKDRNSVFEFINVTPVSGGVRVEWASSASRVYTVQRSTSLTSGFQDVPAATDIPATAPVNTYDDLEAAGPGPYFYRLKIQY